MNNTLDLGMMGRLRAHEVKALGGIARGFRRHYHPNYPSTHTKWGRQGLCKILRESWLTSHRERLNGALKTWPYFSGSYVYPIRPPVDGVEEDRKSQADYYGETLRAGKMLTGEYGYYRVHLFAHFLNYMADNYANRADQQILQRVAARLMAEVNLKSNINE